MLIIKEISKKMEKIILGLIIATLSMGNFMGIEAQGKSGELIKRENIDPKYTWNLKDIYETKDLWEADYKWVNDNLDKFSDFEGTLGNSAEALYKALMFDQDLGVKLGKLYLYASLSKDLDLGNTENQAQYNRVVKLFNDYSAKSSFFTPELLSIPEDKLWSYVEENEDLKVYEHWLKERLRGKDHVLSKELEELMALASPVTGVASDVFGYFKNADIQFPKVKDAEGNDVQISDGRYYAAMYDNDREYRERVYKGYYKPFNDYQNTFASLFNGNLKSIEFNAKARKYESTRAAALDANNIPLEVYDNLVKTCRDNAAPLHRWAELKKKTLKIEDKLHAYDTYVTLFPSVTKTYTYDEAVELCLEALKPLGEDYIASLKKAFDNRWIDVYETKGKRSGAYSSGTTFGMHPYVLLNFNGTLSDVFTLAHEMGHNMHSYYTGLNQPYPYADYSIFVAEVASTMNEALLLDYLIEHAASKEEKLALIEKNLQNITMTFYRQTRFAEFEQLVHEKHAAGESLTPDVLSKYYGELYQAYWGPSMQVDDEEKLTWARIPHFYYNFYVYQYATSFAASQALAAKVKAEGKPAIEKYLNFLKAGSSMYPIDVLKYAGVDMSTPDPVIAVVNKMNELLDKMVALLEEK